SSSFILSLSFDRRACPLLPPLPPTRRSSDLPAAHAGRRLPYGPRRSPALGYVLRGESTTYFAGDTGLFDEMADVVGPCDVALLRSEEHTSELQSRENLVCRLLLEKKKRKR